MVEAVAARLTPFPTLHAKAWKGFLLLSSEQSQGDRLGRLGESRRMLDRGQKKEFAQRDEGAKAFCPPCLVPASRSAARRFEPDETRRLCSFVLSRKMFLLVSSAFEGADSRPREVTAHGSWAAQSSSVSRSSSRVGVSPVFS